MTQVIVYGVILLGIVMISIFEIQKFLKEKRQEKCPHDSRHIIKSFKHIPHIDGTFDKTMECYCEDCGKTWIEE